MKIIKPYITPMNDFDSLEEKIEMCGKVCYKSEDNVKEGSAKNFIKKIIKRGHESVLEHGNIIFKNEQCYSSFRCTDFINWSFNKKGEEIVSGNIRAWRDLIKNYSFSNLPNLFIILKNKYSIFFEDLLTEDFFKNKRIYGDWEEVTDYSDFTKEEKLTHLTHTIKFTTDRAIANEIVRHRLGSYSQESTRYCNYNLGKFGEELTFIEPIGIDKNSSICNLFKEEFDYNNWKSIMALIEQNYLAMIQEGERPEIARDILPMSLKTELVTTYTLKDWRHFFELRCDEHAHPQIRLVAYYALVDLYTSYPDCFKDLFDKYTMEVRFNV